MIDINNIKVGDKITLGGEFEVTSVDSEGQRRPTDEELDELVADLTAASNASDLTAHRTPNLTFATKPSVFVIEAAVDSITACLAAAKEGSEELDLLVVEAALGPEGDGPEDDPWDVVPNLFVTTSVDAGLALIRAALPEWHLRAALWANGTCSADAGKISAYADSVHVTRNNANLPLAICEALLRAMQEGK